MTLSLYQKTAGGARRVPLRQDAPAVRTVVSAQGVDISDAIDIELAALKILGGGELRVVGYSPATISRKVLVDFGRCTVRLGVTSINYTGTEAPPAPGAPASGVIVFRGTTTGYLPDVALLAESQCKVNCNGAAISWTPVAGVAYAGVMFSMCERPVCRGIQSDGSIYYGIVGHYAPGILIDRCVASNVLNENVIQCVGNAEHIRPYDDADPMTWGRPVVRGSTAFNCRNHGIGTWGSVGMSIEGGCYVINCGNNDGTAIAGPAGGINCEYDQNADPTAARNYRMSVTDTKIIGSWGFGLRTNGKGMRLRNVVIEGTRKPTAYADGNPAKWGSAVYVQDNGTVDMDGCLIDGSDLFGVRVQGDVGKFPSAKLKGTEIKGTANRAVYGIGVALFEMDKSCSIHDCGTAAGGPNTIEITNLALNTNAGRARVSGRFDENGGAVSSIANLAEMEWTDISGHNNCKGLASAFHANYASSIVRGKASAILLTDDNAKQARVLKVDGSTSFVLDRDSINGDQTNAAAPLADVVSTKLIGSLMLTAAPTTTPARIGQEATNTTTGVLYIAKGTASAADWVAQA